MGLTFHFVTKVCVVHVITGFPLATCEIIPSILQV